jgi:hypothetical protein
MTPEEKAELDQAYRAIREGLDAYAAKRGFSWASVPEGEVFR